ncbi:MAG TPA: site-specific integrase [Paludibaculum sp.]|jgi:integrase
MAVYKRGGAYYFEFVWKGERIKASTRQGNKRVAEQAQAAKRTELAKAEVGIRERPQAPTLKAFTEERFLPFIEAQFAAKPSTLSYYRIGARNLLRYSPLASLPLDQIQAEAVTGYVAYLRDSSWQTSTMNRALEVLRRAFSLAMEWNAVDRRLPRVRMLPGERRRDRTLTDTEERSYLEAARTVGEGILQDYARALEGIRATARGEVPLEPKDPFLLRDVATVLLDTGLRPEECYRLKWEEIRDGSLRISHGKTENARRTIPLPERSAAALGMRRAAALSPEWVFPAPTKSGHIEKFSLKKRHAAACQLAGMERVPVYTFRHTVLTRWARKMDPYTLAYLAGHSDFSTTKRYVHPNEETVLAAMVAARVVQGPPNSHTRGEAGTDGPGAVSAVIQ